MTKQEVSLGKASMHNIFYVSVLIMAFINLVWLIYAGYCLYSHLKDSSWKPKWFYNNKHSVLSYILYLFASVFISSFLLYYLFVKR